MKTKHVEVEAGGSVRGEMSRMRPTKTTVIHLPLATSRILRKAAFARAERVGGRPSVSALVTEIVEEVREWLEEEASLDGSEMGPQRAQRRRSVSTALRWEMLEAASFKCVACGAYGEKTQLHIDHVIPVSRGGLSDKSNLQVLCEQCNLGKGNKMPRDTPPHQAARYVADPWEEALRRDLVSRPRVTVAECLSLLGLEPKHQKHFDARRLAEVLRRLGYVRRRCSKDESGRREWAYLREGETSGWQ